MNFNRALTTAVTKLQDVLGGSSGAVYIVRDLVGRYRVLLPDNMRSEGVALAQALTEALGIYAHDSCLFVSDLPGMDLSAARLLKTGPLKIFLLDRLVTGAAWNVEPLVAEETPRRFTFYSMKGGVGRSTTVAVLAWHLAQMGKRVLVIDLDLESPGVGSTLLPSEHLPEYGVVDWFVEDALGQAAVLTDQMAKPSPLSVNGRGDVLVVPAFGRQTGDYLAKLGRVYLERGPNGPEAWPSRLCRMVSTLEDQYQPEFVFLDSRTGLHDTSAALIMALGADTLLFAVDSRQTWSAYGYLLNHPSLFELREHLWLVAGMVAEADHERYLKCFRDRAHALFSPLYDVDEASNFSFSLEDPDAPHSPTERHILWSKALHTFDPSSDLDVDQAEIAYRAFFTWFDRFAGVTP